MAYKMVGSGPVDQDADGRGVEEHGFSKKNALTSS